MSIEEAYTIAHQILKDAGCTHPLVFERFRVIYNIINNGDDFSIEDWNNLLKKGAYKDPYTFCAIISHPAAPSSVKSNAITELAILKRSPISQKFIIPLMFSSDNQMLKLLSPATCKILVDEMDWKKFSYALNCFIEDSPENVELPFAGTHIEEALLEKLLYGGVLSPTEADDYKSYKLVEYYSNETSLKNKLEPLSFCNEPIITAVMNNKHISSEFRKEAFIAGPDISLVHYIPDTEQAKIIYESAILSSTPSGMMFESWRCLTNLIKDHQLPVSCELDLVKRFQDGELQFSTHIMKELISSTKNPCVIHEMFKAKRNSEYIIYAAGNPNASLVIDDIIDLYIKSIKAPHNPDIQSEMANIFITACMKHPLNENHYQQILDLTSNSPYKRIVAESMALSPHTPVKTLKEISDLYPSSPVSALAYFNEKSKEKFDLSGRYHFMETMHSLFGTDNEEIKKNKIFSDDFFPSIDSPFNHQLRELLNTAAIEQNRDIKKTVMRYQTALQKSNDTTIADEIINNTATRKISDFPITLLQIAERRIQDNILLMKDRKIGIKDDEIQYKILGINHNYYDVYTVYAGLIKYAPLYKEIEETLKEKFKSEIQETLDKLNEKISARMESLL